MQYPKAKLALLLFRLKPAIKHIVDKHKYQETITSFEAHYSEIDTRVNQEKGILVVLVKPHYLLK